MLHGDYDRRERGLLALYRPRDLVAFSVHIAEARAGVVVDCPWPVAYTVLRAYAAQRGMHLGGPVDGYDDHPLLFLASVIRQRGIGSYDSPLVASAFNEFKYD